MKDKLRQLLALILALSICFSLLSANVWATDEPEDVPTENTEVVTEKDKSEEKQEETPAETPSEGKQEEAPAETQNENKQEETPAEAQSEDKQEETPAQNEAETQPMKKKALGKMPGVSENISLVASPSANLKTISGTHYSVSCGYMCATDSGMQVCKSGALTINARKGETITKVVLIYSWGNNKSSLSASAGTFDGNATISDINAQQVTISSSNTAGVKISAVTVYFEGSLSNPTVTLTGGANAKSSGGLLTQSYLPGAMDTVTYTALTGAAFPEFETYTLNGVTVERTSDTVVTISGTPTANTEITVPDAESSSKMVTWGSSIINDSGVPDAESSSKMVTWGSSIINDSGRNGLEYQIRRNNSYSDTANGITLTKSESGYASLSNGHWMTYGDVTLNFTTATGKFTSIEIETSQIYDGGNWTKDGNTLKWNGTPSNSVSLSGSGLDLEGVSSINFVIEMPTVSVTITPGSNMTKTTDSGAASQTDLSGTMTDVVYTANDGYKFPETNDAYTTTNGITVAVSQDLKTITVSGTPTANTEITIPDAVEDTASDDPYAELLNTTTAVNFDGKEWYLIENNSTAVDAGTVTLLSKECVAASQYNSSGSYVEYASSTVKTAVDNWYNNNITSNAKTAVFDNKMFLLTKDQANAMTTDTRKCSQASEANNNYWWLCSPGSFGNFASCVYGGNGNVLAYGYSVVSALGVRPALKLNLSSVIFSSESKTFTVGSAASYSVIVTAGSNMTKTETSGAASQTDLSGTMTDVVYTADDGYYFPTDYSVATVNGISVTRNSYTQITVSGTPTADASITLTAPTAKTTPDAPTTVTVVNCTTADNNDGKLTGVTAAMEYKKSDAESWTAGTGSDITGLVPGTYYVRVKATDTTLASDNQELTIKGFISYTVTFKVVNGKWNEGEGDAATADKTVTLTGHDGDTLKLTADQIPAVGSKPNDTYKAGSWDVTPSANTAITAETTYTYTYAQKESISQTVTFKVANGKWDDDTAADKTVTLNGYEGDTLKLASNQIPTVGTKPNDTYKAGSWDVMPSTDTAITEATTYTYTYAAKEASVVTKAPTAKTLTYTGSAQSLVNAGSAEGGEMQYALGNATEATQPYTTSIPTATNAGTYYVWYKVVGDANHNSTEPNSVEAKINPVDKTDLNTAIEEAEAYYESIKEDDVYAQVAEALKKAIDEAKKYTNDNVAEKEVKEAIDTIKAAKVDAEEGKKETDDTEATKKVTDAINALPASDKIATTDKEAIEAVRKAYDALTADQKKKVSADTLKKLTDAETALKTAQKDAADKTEADKAIEAINKLPASDKVATTDKAAIEAARKAYDALSADQKKQVPADTLKKLTDAEKALKTAEANDKAAKELATAKAAMNEQVTVTQKGNKFTVKWKKSSVADGYYVYAGYCGKKATKPVKTIKKNTTTKTTITKIDGKKISTKKNFHVYVVPYKIIDGKKVTLGKSTVAHLVGTKSTKYSNVKTLTLTKKKYTVKVGKTAKVKAKVTLVNKNKKHIPKSHGAKFRYKSSDTSIATVSKNGTIKGIKKGTCTIYVYSINGLVKKAKVTVK